MRAWSLALLGALVLSSAGCNYAACRERCSSNSDCMSGLVCYNRQCLPRECERCARGCAYNINDEERTCEFVECR